MDSNSDTHICDREQNSKGSSLESKRTRKCGYCGGHVYPRGSLKDYLYKKMVKGHMIYFCGWNCMREYERVNGATTEQKSRNRISNQNRSAKRRYT